MAVLDGVTSFVYRTCEFSLALLSLACFQQLFCRWSGEFATEVLLTRRTVFILSLYTGKNASLVSHDSSFAVFRSVY